MWELLRLEEEDLGLDCMHDHMVWSPDHDVYLIIFDAKSAKGSKARFTQGDAQRVCDALNRTYTKQIEILNSRKLAN